MVIRCWPRKRKRNSTFYLQVPVMSKSRKDCPHYPLPWLFFFAVFHRFLLFLLPFLPPSPQALVPVARGCQHSEQAQQEPLRLPRRLQVLWRHQHGLGLLQAWGADAVVLVCILLLQHWVRHVLRPVLATAWGVDHYKGNTQSGWYGFAVIYSTFPDIL